MKASSCFALAPHCWSENPSATILMGTLLDAIVCMNSVGSLTLIKLMSTVIFS